MLFSPCIHKASPASLRRSLEGTILIYLSEHELADEDSRLLRSAH